MSLHKSVVEACAKGWPNWQLPYTVRLEEQLQRSTVKIPPMPLTKLAKFLKYSLITVVYGSNFIESAGSTVENTFQICHEIFNGNNQVIEAIESVDEEDLCHFHEGRYLLLTGRLPTGQAYIKSRREVVTHAQALAYMIDRIVIKNEAWSAELILRTHAILYRGLDEKVTAGHYRDHEVAVRYDKIVEEEERKYKTSLYMRAELVPQHMRKMVADLNHELLVSLMETTVDPYTLVARYSHPFLMIHPFVGGNGRMSRIIMNVLLLKYAGHLAHIGHENNKEEYLAVVRRAQKVFTKEVSEVEFWEQASHEEVARYILEKSDDSLDRMRVRDLKTFSNHCVM